MSYRDCNPYFGLFGLWSMQPIGLKIQGIIFSTSYGVMVKLQNTDYDLWQDYGWDYGFLHK
jgi:hypothetical protein